MANFVVSIYDNRDRQVTYIFNFIILVYKLSPLKQKKFEKKLSEGKKDTAKNVHKAPYLGM